MLARIGYLGEVDESGEASYDPGITMGGNAGTDTGINLNFPQYSSGYDESGEASYQPDIGSPPSSSPSNPCGSAYLWNAAASSCDPLKNSSGKPIQLGGSSLDAFFRTLFGGTQQKAVTTAGAPKPPVSNANAQLTQYLPYLIGGGVLLILMNRR